MDESSDYELTDDQQKALLQLQRLQQEMEDDEEEDLTDYGLGYPDYDVAERLKEINAQWDKEPLPDDARQRLIEFKKGEQLTSIYVPPSYPAEQDTARSDHNADDEGGFSSQGLLQGNRNTTQDSENDNSHRMPGKPLSGDESNEQTSSSASSNANEQEKRQQSIRFDNNATVEKYETEKKDDDSESLKSHSSDDNDNRNNSAHQEDKSDNFHSDGSDDEEITSHLKSSFPNTQENKRENSEEQASVTSTLSESEEDKKPDKQTKHEDKTHKSDETQNEERVLVEINGKFELLSVSECQAMGLPIPDELVSDTGSTQSDTYNSYSRRPRPKSSIGPQERGQSTSQSSRSQARAHSAGTSRPYSSKVDWDMTGYISPYGLTKEQKQLKEQREKLIKEREKAYKDRKDEENRRKKEEADSAFTCWLLKKEEEKRAQTSNQQNKQEDNEAKKQENEAAFDAWCSTKRDQQKKERLLKLREQKERDECYFLRSRQECDQAFKSWLKNKRKQEHQIRMSLLANRKRRKHRTKQMITIKYYKNWSLSLTDLAPREQEAAAVHPHCHESQPKLLNDEYDMVKDSSEFTDNYGNFPTQQSDITYISRYNRCIIIQERLFLGKATSLQLPKR